MDNCELSNHFAEKLNQLFNEYKGVITKQELSTKAGYSTPNSITRQLQNEAEPTWYKTCRIIEYLQDKIPNVSIINFLFGEQLNTSDDIIDNSPKRIKEADARYNELETKYNKLLEQHNKILEKYNAIIDFYKSLSAKQKDTFNNLIEEKEDFNKFLTQLRMYTTRNLSVVNGQVVKNKTHFFNIYDFSRFYILDVLCQKTILKLREKYLEKKEFEFNEKFEDKRNQKIKELEDKRKKYRLCSKDDHISVKDKKELRNFKMYVANILEEKAPDFLEEEVPNQTKDINDDLNRHQGQNPLFGVEDGEEWNYGSIIEREHFDIEGKSLDEIFEMIDVEKSEEDFIKNKSDDVF